ncbi:YHYH domain-containing protein [Brevibacillus choshinensis]|uniref:YHYH domain-containing protein n=1 Tax=Brevibacillus choshinensis TaxID=54911 RepID=UPI002E1C1A6D|nr:YHYH domain-containing protein [Brevibacillus choshinensis]MED4779577.1 YHYH domain-containing protein [Brevibacillus choshinensis]
MKYFYRFILAFSLLVIPFSVVEAHPGRTDKNGGHTCRTNCEKWGLQYGQYHYHNGGGTSSGGGSHPQPSSVKPPAPAQPAAPVVQQKTIVAVDQATILAYPNSTESTGTLWYGFEINDLGSADEKFVKIEQGYVSKLLVTQYTVAQAKIVTIATDKAYFFATPIASNQVRGSAIKGTLVQVVGESNGFYYGSTKDANGKILVGFVAKTVVK